MAAPTLDHTVMWQAIADVGNDARAVRDKIYTLGEGSPVVLAYVSSQAEHQVCLVHSPREYRCPVVVSSVPSKGCAARLRFDENLCGRDRVRV